MLYEVITLLGSPNVTRTLSYTVDTGTVQVLFRGKQVAWTSGSSMSGFVEGANTVRVEAVDLIGNVGFAEVTLTVDTLSFPPTFDPLPTFWNQSSYTLRGRMEDGSTVQVSASAGVSVGAVSYPGPSSWQCTVSGLTSGTAGFTAVATDGVGNVSDPVSASLAVDLARLGVV